MLCIHKDRNGGDSVERYFENGSKRRIEYLNPLVSLIDDVDIPGSVETATARSIELALPPAVSSNFGSHYTGLIEAKDSVIIGVTDNDVTVSIRSDSNRQPQCVIAKVS